MSADLAKKVRKFALVETLQRQITIVRPQNLTLHGPEDHAVLGGWSSRLEKYREPHSTNEGDRSVSGQPELGWARIETSYLAVTLIPRASSFRPLLRDLRKLAVEEVFNEPSGLSLRVGF